MNPRKWGFDEWFCIFCFAPALCVIAYLLVMNILTRLP